MLFRSSMNIFSREAKKSDSSSSPFCISSSVRSRCSVSSVLLAVAVDTCSRRSTTIHRFGRREYTTAELRAQFSKLTMSHIQYVLYSLGQTTTRIHNIRAYLLTSLYNAPDTMTFYYSRKVYEDLGYQPVSNFGNNDKSDPFRISEHRLFARSAERKQYAWR